MIVGLQLFLAPVNHWNNVKPHSSLPMLMHQLQTTTSPSPSSSDSTVSEPDGRTKLPLSEAALLPAWLVEVKLTVLR